MVHLKLKLLVRQTSSSMTKKKIILHLCADTGSDTYPYQNDPEYEVRLIGSDMELRSLCSQQFAKAFKKSNP